MAKQLAEVEEFKRAVAEQEVKKKIRENFGVAESQMDRSDSQSSFNDGSQFTALQSGRNKSASKFDFQSQHDNSVLTTRSKSYYSKKNAMMQSQIMAERVRKGLLRHTAIEAPNAPMLDGSQEELSILD